MTAISLLPLRQRVIWAGGWSLLSHVLTQLMRLGGNLVLTRLLFPEAFGMMAIVFVLMTGLSLFSDLGIGQSIVQNPRGEEPEFLDSAWTVQFLRGIAIWLVALAVAWALPGIVRQGWFRADSVYADPMLPPVLSIYAFNAVLQGLETTRVALAQRHLQLDVTTRIELISQVAALAVMLVSAWLYHSIWALVMGGLVSGIVRCWAGHAWLPGRRNKLKWDRNSVREILHFGKWIILLSMIGFLVLNGDRLLLGGLASVAELGLYSIAYLMVGAASTLFSSMASGIVFPAISEVVRQRPDDLAHVYYRFQSLADLFLFFFAGMLWSAGPALIGLLYDHRYIAVGSMLALLAQGLVGMRYLIVDQCCLALGELKLLIVSNGLRLMTLIAGVPLGYRMAGVDGALSAIVLSQFANWPVAIRFKLCNGLMHWPRETIGVPAWCLGWSLGWICVRLLTGGSAPP